MKATKSVGSTFFLLVIILYVFAIIFSAQLGDTLPHYFKTIPLSMFTLFLAGTLLDNVTDVIKEFRDISPWMFIAMQIYILASGFTILNMLIGVLCDVVANVAADEGEKAMVKDTEQELQAVFRLGDADGSGMITHEEFTAMSDYKEVLDALARLGVEPRLKFGLTLS